MVKIKHIYILICLIAPYLPKISYISLDVILKGRFLTYRILFTSGGSFAFAFKRALIPLLLFFCCFFPFLNFKILKC